METAIYILFYLFDWINRHPVLTVAIVAGMLALWLWSVL